MITMRRFEAGAAPPPAVLAARARSLREDSASGGSGRARSASRRSRSASRAISEGTTGGGASSANDDDASWDGDDGGEDDDFVVRPDEADAPDDVETFEEELEREPLDSDAVKIEVDALKAESEVPIEALLATYGGAAAGRLGGASAAPAASDSSDASDSDSDSSADDDAEAEAVKSIGESESRAVKRETETTGVVVRPTERRANAMDALLPDVASVTRESALAEGARIRYEDAVMDRAWSVLQRPPRTKPQPKFPEPLRNKTHWDHLLEEMRWLSGDFVRERKFRQKLARRAAYAVQKSDLDLESRVIKRARDETIAQRKTARNVGNEVMRFWMKVEKVVRFKAQSAVDAKRKTVMDKHLDFLLGQTERYSSMLATKLTGVPEEALVRDANGANGANGAIGAIDAPNGDEKTKALEDGEDGALLPAPRGGRRDGSENTGAEPDDADEDEFVADDAEMAEEDDEATLEEEMRRAAAEGEDDEDGGAEIEDLAKEAEVPIEELLARYREMEAVAEAEATAGKGAEPDEPSEEGPEGDDEEAPDATFADIVEDRGRPRGPSAEDEDEYAVGEGEDGEDDEATLEEEMRRAAAEGEDDEDGGAEIDDLAKEAEVPIEELLARYREMEAAHYAATSAAADRAVSGDDEPSDEDEGGDNEDEAGDDEDEADEPGVASLVDEAEPAMTAEQKAASDARRRVLNSIAGDADALQPKGNTLSSADVKCRVPFLLKHSLREYQHVGLNWLVSCYDKALNGILADEMGLGKTIQTISLLAYLACERGIWGPHLIVVPTSVMLNWEVEFKKWAPAFKLLTYFGTAKERKLKRQGWSKPNAFHVCITTYRLITQDARVFRRKKWKYLILDEAHMIKNWRSQRWQTLLNFNSKRRLLITGTPLQNDLMELWSLMHFLMPHVFQSHSEFKNWFSSPLTGMVEGGDGVNMDLVSRLHGVLRPFLLRRLKSEVEKNLPGKVEHVVHCGLSKRQRRLYEEYMSSSDTSTTLSSGNLLGIINCLMQLRKVCNHPDLFAGRPIVSAFDMLPGVEARVPSCVARMAAASEREEGATSVKNLYAPAGLHLLSLESSSEAFRGAFAFGGGERWSALEARRTAVARDVVLEALASADAEEEDAPVLGRATPDAASAASLFLEARAARRRAYRRAVAARIAANAAAAAARVPVFGADCRRAVTVLLPVRDCHALAERRGAGAFAVAPALLELVKRPTRRASEAADAVAAFVFAIPKARAPAPTMTSATHSAAAALSAKAREAWCQHVAFPALAPLRHAQVRRQLFFPDRRLVQFDCGKLQALATLLRRLKSGGHKVLIFTQMTKMLDILEAFLNLYGYAYCRLDGSTRPEQRQILMQRFNTDDRLFAFILSTRSGGFGINLTGADTVVFYDSDWNPAMDAQAQDRAHRIGQTREVHIYRLVCKGTIEENILRKSMQKRELDHFAIQAGNFNTEHFAKEVAKKQSGGGGDDGGAAADGLVVGGEQGAAAMSIFDQAMSRAAAAKASAPAGGGGASTAETAAAKKGDADEVARLMDEAQDDVDKAAAARAANEEADDAAEFGDDVREKEPGEDLDDDDAKADPSFARGTAGEPGKGSDVDLARGALAAGSPPATPAPDDENRTLSLSRANATAEGDDAFAEEMMRKVQASASRGEALEMQLKPVERYAVRYLEETVRVLEDAEATAANLVAFEEKEWELEQIEKQKAAAEAAEDDDELIIEGWATDDADGEYRRRVEDARREAEARAELERREAERWAALYAVPSLEAERAERARAVSGERLDSESREGGGGSRPAAGDPFVAGVPRRARSGSPAPGGAAAPPLRVLFKLGGAPRASGLSRAPGGAAPAPDAEAKKKASKAREKRKRDGETSAERDERRRLRRLSEEGGSGAPIDAAAFASPGGGRAPLSPAAAGGSPSGPGPAAAVSWRADEDAVLCALVDEFGGASWDLAAHAIAHKDAAQCRDRFRRVVASRAASLAAATKASTASTASPLRVTPEVTKALFRQTAEETFAGCEGALEPAKALRAGVRAARDALATAGGVGAAKVAVAVAAARFFASVLEFGRSGI